MSPLVGCPGPGGFLSGGAFVRGGLLSGGLFPRRSFARGTFGRGVRFFPTMFCRGGDQNNSSVQKYFLYLQNIYTDEMNGVTNMMDECLESGILLYTLNFATARPIYSFHVRLYADTSYTTVRQLLLL